MDELTTAENIEARLLQVMQRDRHALERSWKRTSHTRDQASFNQLFRKVDASCAVRAEKARRLPKAKLDSSLPIHDRVDEIKQLIADHQVVILSGETGSGKSTQLPLIALQMGLGVRGLIGHTQPRRIAARSVAARLAEQIGSPLGRDVGYKVRFADQTDANTYIKLMTDGILLAETQGDRFLDQYEMLIIDEAHERSLNIDFVLGYLKKLLPRRPDLKVIITSATIDTERFAEHFMTLEGRPAPVIHVEGRTYPVDIDYVPIADDAGDRESMDAVVAHCRQLAGRRDGDVLVFLPTEMDIRNTAKRLRSGPGDTNFEILPLYARLSPTQQNEIFKPHAKCRIVLATNVAESSITVPGIRYVVDTGTARISRYAARSKVQRLPIEEVSQASARQRAGRCGRVAPGICIRLYSEENFLSRPEFTTPEIRRTNLAGTILKLLSLGFGDIEQFPFIDPPGSEHIRDGFKTLFEIGAVDAHRRLTRLGRQLAQIPVDPRIARILMAANENHCLSEILIIASALELQDPRVRPAERQAAADAAHSQWNDPKSDFMSYLKLWDFIHHLKESLSRSRFRAAFEQNFLSHTLVQQWLDIHRQLLSLTQDAGMKTHARKDDYAAIHRSLLAGFLSSIAMLEDRHEYLGAGGIRFHLWPGSGVFQSKPKWIVAAELVETTRRFGRTIAAIEPDWVIPLAEHLLKHQYVDPFWSERSESAMAYQNSTLYGLPIRSRQRVAIATIDPETSREFLIEVGLGEDKLRTEFEFHVHNRMLLEEVAKLAKKTRERKWLVDRTDLMRFYRDRIPEEAVDVRSLQRTLKERPELETSLHATRADLGLEIDGDGQGAALPDVVRVGSMQIPVEYRFEPGDSADGANITIPVEALGNVDDVQMGWLIPGLLPDRITAMIRSLPKPIRRNLVPAPDVAREVVKRIRFGEGNLIEAVARELGRFAGQPISPSDFDLGKIDRHLLVNLNVIDSSGQTVASGRNLGEIREQLGPITATQSLKIDDERWNQCGMKDWSWGSLPDNVLVQRGTTSITAFPAIVDEGESVGLTLMDSTEKANAATIAGLNRLFRVLNQRHIRSQIQWLPDLDRCKILLNRWLPSDELREWLASLMPRMGMIENKPIPRDESSFRERQSHAVELLSIATQEIAPWLNKLAAEAQQLSLAMEEYQSRFPETVAAIRRQMGFLFDPVTRSTTPWRWLQHYPRYLKAATQRLERLSSSSSRQDRDHERTIVDALDHYDRIRAHHEKHAWFEPELITYRWMVEELRVSLFAQQLGTSLPVSQKRLEKQMTKIRMH